MQAEKLTNLLNLIWSSPIFGDAFSADMSTQKLKVFRQIETLYPLVVETLEPVLVRGMPLASKDEITELTQRLAPKVVVVCAAIAAGEIAEAEQLRGAALTISLIHWADQGMDKSDEVILAAVQRLSEEVQGQGLRDPAALPPEVQARLEALRWIKQEVEALSGAEDAPILIKEFVQETLLNEAKKQELNRRYHGLNPSDFWTVHTHQVVEISLATALMIYITAIIYTSYRQSQPGLPSLSEIFNQAAIMEMLRGPWNAAFRLFDDFSDRLKDKGQATGLSAFNLNIFNQPEPRWVHTFLAQAGLADEELTVAVSQAFQTGAEESQVYILRVFMDLVQTRLNALPTPIQQSYGVFLTLAKRVMEAGYVYAMQNVGSTIA